MKINTNKPIAAKRVMLTNFNSAISFFRITGVSPIPKINDHKVLLTKKLVSSSGRVEKNVCLTMLANESPKTIKYIIMSPIAVTSRVTEIKKIEKRPSTTADSKIADYQAKVLSPEEEQDQTPMRLSSSIIIESPKKTTLASICSR